MDETRERAPQEVRTRRAVLDLLKREGPQTAAALAARLSVTSMAVRQHLQGLMQEGLVDFASAPGAVGRPAKLWRLTDKAEARFPDAHAELTVGLLDAMRSAFGEEGLERLLQKRAAAMAESYVAATARCRTLRGRIAALARMRDAEGYMTEVRRDGRDGWLLLENHCPICVAASRCQSLCRIELEVFREVLGPEAEVARTEHILLGARRCAYRITRRKAATGTPSPRGGREGDRVGAFR